MAASFKASEKGLAIIDKLRRIKGWAKKDKVWYGLANTSETTLGRFWQRQPITQGIFLEICKAIGANWEEIFDDSDHQIAEETLKFEPTESSTPEPAKTESSPSSTTCHNIPYMGAIKFVGRQTQLETIQEKLQQQNRIAIVAVAGMGGLGKTELALQYAYQHLTDYSGGICWLESSSEQEIYEQILNFAQIYIGLEVPQEIGEKQLNFKQQVDWCWQNWKGLGSVLVVIDDVGEFYKIQPYLPPAKSRFKVLMTTRLLLPNIQALNLDVLTLQASLELLESEYLIGKERIAQEQDIAISLCEWLGYLPLGLELAGRYLNQDKGLSIASMVFRLQEKSLQHKALMREENDQFWNSTAQRGVAAAFELSWELLDGNSQRLGKILSLFGSTLIPWYLVENVEGKRCDRSPRGEHLDINTLEDARKNLLCFHLLQYGDQQTYLLHSLIRKFFKTKLEESNYANN